MAEIWPATLPQHLLVEGHGTAFGDGRLRSPMEMGPAKVRRRSSAIPAPLSGTMVMTEDQVADLSTFVVTTTLGGSLAFFMPYQGKNGGADILVRFGESLPSWVAIGDGNYRVTLQLEALP